MSLASFIEPWFAGLCRSECVVLFLFVYLENAIMLKKSFIPTLVKESFFAVSFLSTGVLVALAPQSNSATSKPEVAVPVYEEGSVVTAYAIDQNRKGQAIGRFMRKEPDLSMLGLSEVDELKDFREQSLGYEADAYFVAKEAGEYLFAAQINLPPTVLVTKDGERQAPGWMTCRYQLIVASQPVFYMEASSRETRDHDRACGFAKHGFGAIQLEAGRHRMRQWVACSGERELKDPTTEFVYPAGCDYPGMEFDADPNPTKEVSVQLRVRHPQEDKPVLVKTAELVHEKR